MAKCPTMEEIMGHICYTFDKYAGADGNSESLNKDELIKLAKAEFPNLSAVGDKDDVLKGIIGKMDLDGNNEVTFMEYGIFLVYIMDKMKRHCNKK